MDAEIIIVGAGAAGLMAARELSKAGKKVLVLEARDRIGGRIMPLDKDMFGFPAQGGAEFVHGKAPVTRGVITEANLTFIPDDGELWTEKDGELMPQQNFLEKYPEVKERLASLTEDMPLGDFLERYFSDPKYVPLRGMIQRIAEGYDAADVRRISTFAVRSEWLGGKNWTDDGRIKEGYGALMNFLESECKKADVEIRLHVRVDEIRLQMQTVFLHAANGDHYLAEKVIVTVPLPVLKTIIFNPEFEEKITLAEKIGYGGAIKVVMAFKNRWWEKLHNRDTSKLSFFLCSQTFMTWWTQYPEPYPVLIGWMAGPNTDQYKTASDDKILETALTSIANAAKIPVEYIRAEMKTSHVINWPNDQFAQGAYSYASVGADETVAMLSEPIMDAIYFAGEALYSGEERSTVEGALGSGKEVAQKILGL